MVVCLNATVVGIGSGSAAGRQNAFDALMRQATEKGAEALFRNQAMRSIVARRISTTSNAEQAEKRVAEKCVELLGEEKRSLAEKVESIITIAVRKGFEDAFKNFQPPLREQLAQQAQARFVESLGSGFGVEIVDRGLTEPFEVFNKDSVRAAIVTRGLKPVVVDAEAFAQACGLNDAVHEVVQEIGAARDKVRIRAEEIVGREIAAETAEKASVLFSGTLSSAASSLVSRSIDASAALQALRDEEVLEAELVEDLAVPTLKKVFAKLRETCREKPREEIAKEILPIAREIVERTLDAGSELGAQDFEARTNEMVSSWLKECEAGKWKTWNIANLFLKEMGDHAATLRVKHAKAFSAIASCPFEEVRGASSPELLAAACTSLVSRIPPRVLAGSFISKYASDKRVVIGGRKFGAAYSGEALKPLMAAIAIELENRGTKSPLLAEIYDYCISPGEVDAMRARLSNGG